jgi:hypothetical protein
VVTVSVAFALAILSACTETRVVRYNPILGDLPGAESGTPVVRDLGGYKDPGEVPDDELQKTLPDGKVLLFAKTGKHLMNHIHNTLEADDKKLFVSQVLSQLTKRECIERNVDPGECFEILKAHREDIDALFDRMPGAERTPGVFPMPLGGNVTRVELGPKSDGGLLWGGFDMVMEHGNYRLRWFVPAYQ